MARKPEHSGDTFPDPHNSLTATNEQEADPGPGRTVTADALGTALAAAKQYRDM